MKRLAVFFSILLSLCLAANVFAAAYTATFVISETASASYTMLPMLKDAPITWLSSNGYITSTGLDTRIETLAGLEKPHVLATDKILTAVAVPADSQTNLNFTTGNSALTSMNIIAGYDGYYTITDAAALELGNNFEIEIDGYVDTSAGATKNLVYKQDSFLLYISAANTITAILTSAATNTTLAPDGAGTVTNVPNLFGAATHWQAVLTNDGDTSYVGDTTNDGNYYQDSYACSDMVFPTTTKVITSVVIHIVGESNGVGNGNGKTVLRTHVVDYLGAEETLANGVYTDYSTTYALNPNTGVAWTDTEINDMEIGVTLKVPLGATEVRCTQVYAVVNYYLTPTVSGAVAAGESVIEVTADGVALKLYDDTVELDSESLNGATTVDNANTWYLGQNDVTPYMSYYKHTVGGVLIAWYQPVTIITNTYVDGTADAGGDANTIIDAVLTQADDYWNFALVTITDTTDNLAPIGETAVVLDFAAGTDEITLATNLTAGVDAGDTYTVEFGTLVDRQGAAQDARITWGVNPTGIAIALGSLTSISQPSTGQTIDSPDIDILPPVSTSDWYEEPDVTGTLLTNPLRPFVTIMSDSTSLTEMQAWRLLALAFVLFFTVVAAVAVRSHLLIAGIVCGSCIGLMVAFTIFPLWSVVFIIGAIAAGVIAERSPSL